MFYSVEISGGCAGPRVPARIFLNVNILYSISISKSAVYEYTAGAQPTATVETKL